MTTTPNGDGLEPDADLEPLDPAYSFDDEDDDVDTAPRAEIEAARAALAERRAREDAADDAVAALLPGDRMPPVPPTALPAVGDLTDSDAPTPDRHAREALAAERADGPVSDTEPARAAIIDAVPVAPDARSRRSASADTDPRQRDRTPREQPVIVVPTSTAGIAAAAAPAAALPTTGPLAGASETASPAGTASQTATVTATMPAPVGDAPAASSDDTSLPVYAHRTSLRERATDFLALRATARVPRDVPVAWRGIVEWAAPALLLIVAALLRFVALDHPHALVFDETYYVKDAWSLAHLGYEGSWPDKPDAQFAAGETMIFTETGTRVVHPPLGKWLIALGMLLFGADNGFGWRFATALAGTLTVLVVYMIVRRMTGKVTWASVAGLFVAVDGVSIVLSRVSLLDGILTFFVMLGVLFIVVDHRGAAARIARTTDSFIGPVMWNRPWVIAAGAAFGCAAAVKWSGFYVLAAFGLYLVASDAFMRRRAGVQMWGSAAIGRQGPVTFALYVPVALIVYVTSWIGWLATQGGYKRDSDANPLIALVNYHLDSLGFHLALSSPHTYASPAWQWPFLVRPTSMYWDSQTCGTGAGEYQCVEAITAIPNPLVWWAGVIAVVAIVWGLIRYRDWRYAIVLVGLAAAYLPWLGTPDRTIFQFYTVLIVPFLAISLALALERWTSGTDPRRARERRVWRMITIGLVIAVVAVSAFFLPLWTGMRVPYQFWLMHMWFPSWI